MQTKTYESAMAEIKPLLEACFGEEPTAGAVMVISGDKSYHLIVINMNGIEVVNTLVQVVAASTVGMGIHAEPETIQ